MRGVDRIDAHQFADGILPLRRLPQKGERHQCANDRGDEFGDPQDATLRLVTHHAAENFRKWGVHEVGTETLYRQRPVQRSSSFTYGC